MARPRLEVRDAVGRRVVPLDQLPFGIGRRESNALRLSGSQVSRDHAEITAEGEAFILRDRGSRWGTYVNGEQVTERQLSHGDRILFGRLDDTEILFVIDEDGDDAVTDAAPEMRHDDLRQIATLLEGLRALGTGRVIDEVLTLVLDSALDLSGAERGFVMMPGATDELEFKRARARGKAEIQSRTFATSRKIPEEVFRTGQTRIVIDLLDGDLPNTHMGTVALGIRFVICVPLHLVRYLDQADAAQEERCIGVLYLDSRERGKFITEPPRVALETLANQAAVAIENARLYRETMAKAKLEQELGLAAQVQQALLPQPNVDHGFVEAAAHSIPCRSIGADFFDYYREQRDPFSFIVGDVAGKGPSAAFLSAVIQGMCGMFVQDAEEPAIAVASINTGLCHRRLDARFAMVFFGVLSSDGKLTYCNAGYPEPIVIGPGGVRRLSTGGAIVGVLADCEYEQETVQLKAGDSVIIFSDGVSEAINSNGEEFGEPQILASAEREWPTASARTLVQRILDSVRAFSQTASPADDLTVMAVRYVGQPSGSPNPND